MRRMVMVASLVLWLSAAPAHAQTVRLAAPCNCLVNFGCGLGLRSVYGLNVRSAFRPLANAEAGISALDDGLADVAVTFSSNPQLSRPDIVTLRDDKRMVYADHVVPVVRRKLLREYGRRDVRDLRARLNAASAAVSTKTLRTLNQAVVDGRLPEAVGGEFAGANGFVGRGHRRPGPRIVVGYMAFDENQLLAYMYAEALRSAGFRVRVRSVGGVRAAAVRQLRRDQIDLFPAYDGSLLRYLVGNAPARLAAGLRHTLARIDAEPLRLAPAERRQVYVMKADAAARLGIAKLSDLARYWQTAGQ